MVQSCHNRVPTNANIHIYAHTHTNLHKVKSVVNVFNQVAQAIECHDFVLEVFLTRARRLDNFKNTLDFINDIHRQACQHLGKEFPAFWIE